MLGVMAGEAALAETGALVDIGVSFDGNGNLKGYLKKGAKSR
jgi:hypothetical protein